ncbi:MAG: hypothetical protein D6689_10135 [Deltaproteobacteria bacterium]|nr:MAG: hypothetical protein D6689_10135 [Deltaproteobacteria bacterium]
MKRTVLAVLTAAVTAALAAAAARPAAACGMPMRLEPADENLLAEAEALAEAEEYYAAIRLYDRAAYDDRADIRIRLRAAYRAARLRVEIDDPDGAARSYALAAHLAGIAAVHLVRGEFREPQEAALAAAESGAVPGGQRPPAVEAAIELAASHEAALAR